MNSAQHKITVNAGTNQTKTFSAPASRWMEFVETCKAEAAQAGLLVSITVESERRGVIYEALAA